MSLRSPNAAIEKGGYSVIVYLDGDLCVAEDNLGTTIKENSDAATVIQAAIDSLEDIELNDIKLGRISLLKGTFNLSSSLAFPYYYYTDHHVGLILEGLGNATTLNYTPTTGYALSLSAEGATSDSRTSSNHLIQDLKVLAPNTTDGAILFEGACRNVLSNIKMECANGNAIRIKQNSYGSISLRNILNNVDIHKNTKCCVYGTDNSRVILNNCDMMKGDPDCVYFDGGRLYLNNTELEGATNAINRIGGKTIAFNLYINGGNLLFDGGIFRAFGSNLQFFKPSNNCDYEISTSFNSGNQYINFPQIAPPFNFINRGIQCDVILDGASGYGVTVDDVNASNGKANKNETSDVKGFVFYHRYCYYNYIPRGKYLFLIRLKDTNSVTDQVQVKGYNWTDSTYFLNAYPTLTSGYKTYAFTFMIDAADVGDLLEIAVYKDTVAPNTIYADFYKIVYLGTEWEDFTMGGGHQLLLIDDIGTYPAADVNYRGMLAFEQAAVGVADTLKMCMKSAADTYSWVVVKTA